MTGVDTPSTAIDNALFSIVICEELVSTCAMTSLTATWMLVELSFREIEFSVKAMGALFFFPVVTMRTTEFPFETYADAVSGRVSSKSVSSVERTNSGIFTTVSHVAERIAFDSTSGTVSELDGE